jgi:hypothetical protein
MQKFKSFVIESNMKDLKVPSALKNELGKYGSKATGFGITDKGFMIRFKGGLSRSEIKDVGKLLGVEDYNIDQPSNETDLYHFRESYDIQEVNKDMTNTKFQGMDSGTLMKMVKDNRKYSPSERKEIQYEIDARNMSESVPEDPKMFAYRQKRRANGAIDEALETMSSSRLKFHAIKKFPHGRYTSKEIEKEHEYRRKTEPNYHAVKPSLDEDTIEENSAHTIIAAKKANTRAHIAKLKKMLADATKKNKGPYSSVEMSQISQAIERYTQNLEDMNEAVSAKKYRVHVTTKDGEKFKSGAYSDKKKAMDMHWSLSKNNKHKSVEIVAESVTPIEDELAEAMNLGQRRRAAISFRKNKGKIALGKKKAERRMPDKDRLEKRARRAARTLLMKKLTKGVSKDELDFARREAIEKRLDKMTGKIDQLAKRLLPKIRKSAIEKNAKRKSSTSSPESK